MEGVQCTSLREQGNRSSFPSHGSANGEKQRGKGFGPCLLRNIDMRYETHHEYSRSATLSQPASAARLAFLLPAIRQRISVASDSFHNEWTVASRDCLP